MAKKEIGVFETPAASKYLQQLCKHFGHKIEATCDAQKGVVHFAMGPAHLSAEADALTVEINAPDQDGIERARDIIDRHLERFAFREEFAGFDWKAA